MSKVIKILFHQDANISKLATREDPKHIHKTLGILSVLSFIYRYGYVFPTTGTLGFASGDSLAWVSMAIHTLLAFSSVIFRVPAKRIDTKPMIIYEEYRQHAMVFTLRCFSVFAAAILFPNAPTWFVPLVVAAHHAMADNITARHGSGNTAVRAVSNKLQVSQFYKNVGKLYRSFGGVGVSYFLCQLTDVPLCGSPFFYSTSFYQFLAIASHISPNAALPDMAFNAIVAIQSSAFMMTLYRKRIIKGKTHMAVYSLCLVLSAYHIIRVLGWTQVALVAATFLLRVNLPRKFSNKYVLWTLFLLVPHAAHALLLKGGLPAPLIPVLAAIRDGFFAGSEDLVALPV